MEIHEVSYNRDKRQYLYDKSHNRSNFRKHHSSSPHNKHTNNLHTHQTPAKMKCYYCEGEHYIDEHEKFKKDKRQVQLK